MVSCVFFNILIFNWRIIALQCCVGFCRTTMLISHQCKFRWLLSNPEFSTKAISGLPSKILSVIAVTKQAISGRLASQEVLLAA